MGKEDVSAKSPSPVWRPQIQRDLKNPFYLRRKGFLPHIRYPNAWDLHQKDEPPKHLALKTSVVYVQVTHKAVENRDSTLKELSYRLTHQGSRAKPAV